MRFPLRLGTRGSPLALTQANMVSAALIATHGWARDSIDIVPIRTSGDRIQDRALAEVGGKALWTKELDRALIDGDIDFAVHSMKDVETIRPAEIVIAAMLERADVRDRLIGAESLDALAPGARIGTSAPRRTAQVLRRRPDCTVVLFRGNVDTRLTKLAAGEAEATLLAAAGLERLGRTGVGHAVPIGEMLPAPSQGAVGIETLATNGQVRDAIAAIDHVATHRCVAAERALLAGLGGDCRSPVAALAVERDGAIHISAEIYAADGNEAHRDSATISHPDEARALGERMVAQAPAAIAALFGR